MTTKQETALAVKGRVESRVAMSGALLERMGYTVEQYERVCLNALLVSPGLAECTPAFNGHSDHPVHNGGADTRRETGGNHPVQTSGYTGADDGRVGNAGAPGDQGAVHPNAGGVRPGRLGIRGGVDADHAAQAEPGGGPFRRAWLSPRMR